MNRFKNNLKNRCYFFAFFQATVGQREASFSRRACLTLSLVWLTGKKNKKQKQKQKQKNAGSPQASLWRKKLLRYSLETPELN